MREYLKRSKELLYLLSIIGIKIFIIIIIIIIIIIFIIIIIIIIIIFIIIIIIIITIISALFHRQLVSLPADNVHRMHYALFY